MWDDGVAGPRYDSAKCDLKGTQKCALNGKPDNGYLHWRWQPAAAGCNLSALDPAEFLGMVRGKRLAFVGDSTARNQAEALVCFLSTFSRPETTHRYEERPGAKFWRWVFPAPHDVIISTYWSPFLVRADTNGTQTQGTAVFLDALTDEPWAADVDAMDVVVISAGHWFPRPAVYYEAGRIIGAFSRPDVVLNGTDISGGYLGVYRRATRAALEHVDAESGRDKLVVVATIAPAHFELSWDHRDACSRTKPYDDDGWKVVGETEAEMRKAVVEETAMASARRRRWGMRYEVLDVTRMAALRPDSHPGVYIYEGAYAGAPVPEKAPNDCLHYCAPGPVDTFNDVLARMIAAARG